MPLDATSCGRLRDQFVPKSPMQMSLLSAIVAWTNAIIDLQWLLPMWAMYLMEQKHRGRRRCLQYSLKSILESNTIIVHQFKSRWAPVCEGVPPLSKLRKSPKLIRSLPL